VRETCRAKTANNNEKNLAIQYGELGKDPSSETANIKM
jgi:hypothetical protein